MNAFWTGVTQADALKNVQVEKDEHMYISKNPQ